jgi:hypothetical protein
MRVNGHPRAQGQPAHILRAIMVVAWVAFAIHNFLPYLGLRWQSCQTMYSGLRTGRTTNNHLFVPQWSLSSVNTYYRVARFELDPPVPASETSDLRFIPEAIKDLSNVVVSDEGLRRIVHNACRARRTVRLDYRTMEGDRVTLDDACLDSRFQPRAWLPVELYDPAVRMAIWHECQPPVRPSRPVAWSQNADH